MFNRANPNIDQLTNIEPSLPPLPHRAGGPRPAQKQHAGLPYPEAQPSAASIGVPESAHRDTVFDSVRRDDLVG